MIDEKLSLAKQLHKDKKYSEAIEIYKDIWTESNTDKWIGWEYAHCLKYSNRIDDAISICKNTYKIDNKFLANNNLLAWCMWEKYFPKEHDKYSRLDVQKIEKIADYVTNIIEQRNDNPYVRIVLYVVGCLKDLGDKSSYEKILLQLTKLNQHELTDETTIINGNDGRTYELESPSEAFYSNKTKALVTLCKYSECIECCKEALNSIKKFHYSNDIWIKSRMYYSMGMNGDTKEAVEGLNKLTTEKQHFSLLYETALVYSVAGEDNKSLMFLYKALASEGKLEMKLNVIYTTAITLEKLNKIEAALKHYLLYKSIKEKNRWNISKEIEDAIIRCNVGNDISKVSVGEMNKFWVDEIKKNIGKVYGKVSRILDNKNGFIQYDNESIYFRHTSILHNYKMRLNENVSFCISKSFDKKKNRDSFEAIYIEVEDKNERRQ